MIYEKNPMFKKTLHARFEEKAREMPDSVALEYEGKTLTYGELNCKSNQVAHYLQSKGVGPEVRVGLCLRRGLDLVIGLVGILKAGGAYVPLDPSYPLERLKYIAEDSQVAVLLKDDSVGDWFLSGGAMKVVDMKSDSATIAAAADDNPVADSGLGNLAYVIYTSGSTGKPKGVAVAHGNVMRLFAATQPWFSFDANDVWTMFHSYAFDFSVWELWGGLLFGGKVVIVSHSQSRSPEEMYRLLSEGGVTVLNQTPSAFKNLLEEDGRRQLDLKVRILIFGGEALAPRMLAGWRERHPHTRLVNMYGITEITIHGTYMELGDLEVQRNKSVIGEAIPDLRFYVVNEEMKLVPPENDGELYVAGAGLARGYLNRPELTAASFVPDPFGKQPGERMYKTGDRVRWRSQGGLEFLGRMDNQVKIRGYRIELGEIEAVLREHEDVSAAAVVAIDEDGGKRLVAYIASSDRVALQLPELRKHLERRLPDYMVPAAYVFLDSLPLTNNGKLDLDALPSPEAARPQEAPDLVKPRTAVEEMLCDIWAQVLGLDEAGVEDDFFEFGGHSLLATQVISQVRRVFGIDISLHYLFEAPTVSAFARALEEVHAQEGGIGGALLDEVEKLPAD